MQNKIEILLVEDNNGDVWLTKEAFKDSDKNINIEVVVDGEQALEYLQKRAPYEQRVKPDLILLDLNLPKWDGREVLKKIKSDDELKHIPVIVLTTSNAQHDVRSCYGSHANCFITKPVDYDSFFEIIKNIETFWLNTAVLPR